MKQVCVFIFRRDFRVTDNTAFFHAVAFCKEHKMLLWPVFVFRDSQISPRKNAYYSERCFRFMMHALYNLSLDLGKRLDFVMNRNDANNDLLVLSNILKETMPDAQLSAVFFNKDLTPFAKRRDQQITDYANQRSIHVGAYEDYTVYPMNTILNKNNKPFLVFTPFYNTVLKRDFPVVVLPKPNKEVSYIFPNRGNGLFENRRLKSLFVRNPLVTREHVIKTLFNDKERTFKDYKEQRDCMGLENGTTRIGPYLKFGLVSTRETVQAFVRLYGKSHELVKQLYWREFYYITHDAYPHMLQGQVDKRRPNRDFNPNVLRDKVWNPSEADFRRWTTGNTGKDLVDAAMRQLNETGYMHNRGRMVVASYLIKNLKMDWRKGERYFATQLVDYDPCQNNSGWQWSSGGGVSANPWYRKFNPDIQAEKYDPTGAYRKRYLKKNSNK